MNNNIGFMQGRLSPTVNNVIQEFPFNYWEDEFPQANKLNINLMEWTLDYPNLRKNPLLQDKFLNHILFLSNKYNLKIPSVTLDCCMQRPFWKEKDSIIFDKLIDDFITIISYANNIKAKILVLPLVDNGSIHHKSEFDLLKKTLESLSYLLMQKNIKIAFESDYSPLKLTRFIDQFDPTLFGINYDSGNSSALGYDPFEEIHSYGRRILNVHIKDRFFKGTTVRLGCGATSFQKIFDNLKNIDYTGNFILQTARAKNNNHYEELKINLLFLKKYLYKKNL